MLVLDKPYKFTPFVTTSRVSRHQLHHVFVVPSKIHTHASTLEVKDNRFSVTIKATWPQAHWHGIRLHLVV